MAAVLGLDAVPWMLENRKNVQNGQASIIGKTKFVTFLQRHSVFHELHLKCFRHRLAAMTEDRLSVTNVAEHILPYKPTEMGVCIDLVSKKQDRGVLQLPPDRPEF